jgi:hypothetical protein
MSVLIPEGVAFIRWPNGSGRYVVNGWSYATIAGIAITAILASSMQLRMRIKSIIFAVYFVVWLILMVSEVSLSIYLLGVTSVAWTWILNIVTLVLLFICNVLFILTLKEQNSELFVNDVGGKFWFCDDRYMPTVHIIDLDCVPAAPESLSVIAYSRGGQLKWDISRTFLYQSPAQKNNGTIEGNKLREELKGRRAYNANLLDYLLDKPHLIPIEWKNRRVFFWGTIYRHNEGYECVRYLFWNGGKWNWSDSWLGSPQGGDSVAVVAVAGDSS